MARAKSDTPDTSDVAVDTTSVAAPEEPAPADPADPAEPRIERTLRVTAAAESRWRGGLQFGRAAVDLGEADIRAAAATRGMSPEDWEALLAADPVLALVPGSRPMMPEPSAS